MSNVEKLGMERIKILSKWEEKMGKFFFGGGVVRWYLTLNPAKWKKTKCRKEHIWKQKAAIKGEGSGGKIEVYIENIYPSISSSYTYVN